MSREGNFLIYCIEQYKNAKNCLFTRGIDDAEGNGNFTIGITQGGKLTEVLFMLDSHGCVNSDKEEKVISTNWVDSYDKAKKKEAELVKLDSEVTKLQSEIDNLTPWENLDIAFGELKSLRNTSYYLGTIAKGYEEKVIEELSNCYIEIISRSTNDVNLLILANKEYDENISEVLRSIGFSSFKTEYTDVPLKLILDFKHRIEEIQSRKFFVQEEISDLEEDLQKLELAYDYFASKVERIKASRNFLNKKKGATL